MASSLQPAAGQMRQQLQRRQQGRQQQQQGWKVLILFVMAT
jgi:hypothetical protein